MFYAIITGSILILVCIVVIITKAIQAAATWMDDSFRWGGRDDG